MGNSNLLRAGVARVSASSLLAKWKRDQQGTTAIEVAVVAGPFFLFMFGVIGLGLHFYTQNLLEFAVETASRKIRTGEAQQNTATDMTAFKNSICSAATGLINCSKVRVHVQSAAAWSGITPTPCLGSGNTLNNGAAGTTKVSAAAGGASSAVLVTVCYEWELAKSMPFLGLGNMAGGSALIQAVAAFKTEPY